MGKSILCWFVIGIGIMFGKLDTKETAPPSAPTSVIRTGQGIQGSLSQEEMDHLSLLGTMAGVPGIIDDAIKSGNIFDPMHMEKAQKLKREWEEGQSVLAPFIGRQDRIDAEREQLGQMGRKMGGTIKPGKYAIIEDLIGVHNLGLPADNWILRIQAVDDFVDLRLAPYKDYIADCLIDACWNVPQFDAVLMRPEMEPVVIYSHPVA